MIYSSHFIQQVAKSNLVQQIKDGVLIMDNSEYSSWDGCFAMGLMAGALKRVNARSRGPLAFGGAVHAGLDAFFKGQQNWREVALADAELTKLDSIGDPKRNTRVLQNLLESYILEYKISKSMRFDILTLEGKPCIEQSFSIPLGEVKVTFQGKTFTLKIVWMGKMDMLTRYEGALTPVDHKTTTVMGEKFADDLQRGTQMPGYTYAARYLSAQLFGDMPVFGVRINALAMRSTGFEFKQFDLPFPDWKIAEWQHETLTNFADLVYQLDRFLLTGEAIPTRAHCVTKYGKCPYFDVCDTPAKMRDRMIFDDSYYFVSDWSPLNE